jgi:hypothetical protein
VELGDLRDQLCTLHVEKERASLSGDVAESWSTANDDHADSERKVGGAR